MDERFFARAAAISPLALLDLVKAFERLPYHLLVIAATRKSFPLVLVRLSLVAYRLQQVIGIEGFLFPFACRDSRHHCGSWLAMTDLRDLRIVVVIVAHHNWSSAQLE